MAISLKHTTQAVGVDAGNGEIRKAQWNEEHTLTQATARMLGRTTADEGPTEEISVGSNLSLSAGVLNTASTVALLAGTQTLTNKTISGANNTITDLNATNLSSGTVPSGRLPNSLSSIHALTPAADRLPYYTSASAAALATFTAFGRSLVDDASAAAARTTMGLGTAATMAGPSGAIVGTTDTQTLTNKTLTAPTISGGTVSALAAKLAISDGGTGAGTAAVARTNLGLGASAIAAILGTVSQSAGVPTGDIFETGSNANGDFVRLASGLQICTRTITPSTGPETTAGNVFRDDGTAWTFPAAFASTPLVVGWSGLWFTWVSPANATNNATVANFHVMRSNSTAAAIAVRVAAIGNWF